MAFNGSLMLLGIGVGWVIPITTTGDRGGRSGPLKPREWIVFMCQLSGAALMLAVSTTVSLR